MVVLLPDVQHAIDLGLFLRREAKRRLRLLGRLPRRDGLLAAGKWAIGVLPPRLLPVGRLFLGRRLAGSQHGRLGTDRLIGLGRPARRRVTQRVLCRRESRDQQKCK